MMRGLVCSLFLLLTISMYWLLTDQGVIRDFNEPIESMSGKRTDEEERKGALRGFTPALTIGADQREVEQALGKPDRIEPSGYGYDWWIYLQDWEKYIQVGIQEEKVNTFYTNALDWQWGPWRVGMPYEEWSERIQPTGEVTFTHNGGSYTFLLSEAEQRERPLFVEGNVAVQLYIDRHDKEKIAGLRVMNLDTLLLHRPYTLRYVGSLPDKSERRMGEEGEVEKTFARQIFDLTNVDRVKRNLSPLLWDDQVAQVAKGHSADMERNNYFDHISPFYGDLGQRLSRRGISFLKAGENIAWNYVDAAEAHHGWMNSSGHRQNIIDPDFTHMGVGVAGNYFTQNFIQSPDSLVK